MTNVNMLLFSNGVFFVCKFEHVPSGYITSDIIFTFYKKAEISFTYHERIIFITSSG